MPSLHSRRRAVLELTQVKFGVNFSYQKLNPTIPSCLRIQNSNYQLNIKFPTLLGFDHEPAGPEADMLTTETTW